MKPPRWTQRGGGAISRFMALLPILQFPDPRLRLPCLPVGEVTPDILTLTKDMLATMYAAEGRGLAAPQVGVLRRLFVMDVVWKDDERAPQVFIDPLITATSAEMASFTEGCLSIPGVPSPVSRPAAVTLEWTGPDGARRSETFTGIAAVCVQHEYDHLNGRLCIDLMEEEARRAASETLAALDGIAKVPQA